MHRRFFDLQVNGYRGVDFNADQLDVDALASVCDEIASDGVEAILATVITAHTDAMCRRLANIVRARESDDAIARVIQGIHIEGPFLNEQPGYIGAHPADAAQPASIDVMQQLLEAAGGLTRIVTLAPERDDQSRVTRMLAEQGICVSAGHCNPSLAELEASIDAGLTMFTHLGNGCPLEMHRHDNIIQRVLALADRLWVGFIADGVHVPLPALGNYLRLVGPDRAIVVTDAISAAGCGPGTYELADQTVVVDENLATWHADQSHLIGSAATMPFVVENLRNRLGLDDQHIEKLTSINPRAAIGQ